MPSTCKGNQEAIKSVGIVVNTMFEGSIPFAMDLAKWLEARGVRVSTTRNVTQLATQSDGDLDELVKTSDLLVAMGGDGTLLGVGRRAAPFGKLILGIHWGGMGFLNECNPDQTFEALERILNGNYQIEERMMILAEVWRDGRPGSRYTALNDVAVTRETLSRILRVEVVIGDEIAAVYRGDGVIVSTPTGSTAHSLAAGGSVLDPRVDAFSITPICPHSLSGRAIIVPTSEKLQLRHSSAQANVIITLDGQVGIPMKDEDRLDVSRAPWMARFVRLGYTCFYRTLREKLHWKVT